MNLDALRIQKRIIHDALERLETGRDPYPLKGYQYKHADLQRKLAEINRRLAEIEKSC